MNQQLYKSITIRLKRSDYEALLQISDQECRYPSRQAALWVSQCIQNRLQSPSTQKEPADPGRPSACQ